MCGGLARRPPGSNDESKDKRQRIVEFVVNERPHRKKRFWRHGGLLWDPVFANYMSARVRLGGKDGCGWMTGKAREEAI